MTVPLLEPSPIAAAEENLAAAAYSYRVLPGARLLDTPGVFAVVSEIPLSFFNVVARTAFAPDEAAARVAETLRPFRDRVVPVRWWMMPTTSPRDLPAHLLAAGMRLHYDAPTMIADLSALPPAPPADPTLRIERVRDGETLARWALTLMQSFDRGADDAARFAAAFAALGLGEDADWQHFYGHLDGEPAATASIFVGGGSVGVYHVGTLPAARGRGAGSALTRAGLEVARERGIAVASLQSSRLGYGVYSRLGFVTRGRLAAYELP